MEIWNLVFIQSNRNEKGELEDLPAKHVDTGMGFERVCAILQGKDSNYDTDVFMPVIDRIADTVGKRYTGMLDSPSDIAMRVIADHIRMLTFSIADGAIPSNEGRGYVLRRILRRAARFGRNLGMHEPFIYKISGAVVESMGNAFPEIVEKQAHIEKVIKAEEEGFNATLDTGITLFNRMAIGTLKTHLQREGNTVYEVMVPFEPEEGGFSVGLTKTSDENFFKVSGWDKEKLKRFTNGPVIISGEDTFKLYDTYGFPLDLTQLMAEERGLKVDVDRFTELMEEQRKRSRQISSSVGEGGGVAAGSAQVGGGYGKESARKLDIGEVTTAFVGYETLETETRIVGAKHNLVALETCPFYAESGGQIGDVGILKTTEREYKVTDAQRGRGGIVLVLEGSAKELDGVTVRAIVDRPRRINIQRNHSATHLVHEALRRVLGTHVHQQGSLVAADHLRFDFPHFGKITPEEIRAIEDIVNEKISDDISVFTEVDLPIEKARKIPNVKMFFGDKYGDTVRVVFIDENFSVEFCGGTHVKDTKDIGLFKIVSESSIASGVRRIEAVTGEGITQYINDQLKKVKHVDDQLAQLIEETEMLEREMTKYAKTPVSSSRPSLGTLTLPSNEAESIRVLEKELAEREQAVQLMAKRTQDLRKDLSTHKVQNAAGGIEALVAGATSLNGFKIVSSKVDASDMEELKRLGDTLRAKLGSGVGVLASVIEEKVALVCVVTDDLIKGKNLQAGKIVGEMAKQVGGGGGGRPHLATAGGKDVTKLDEVLRRTSEIVQAMMAR
jgi:alanyl-tRNA synthetase